MKEQVLVFPSKMLEKVKFKNNLIEDSDLAHKLIHKFLEHSKFMERDKAEIDVSQKQLIGYCLLYKDNKIFSYKRTKKGGEKRLHDLWSIGIGGHCSKTDINQNSDKPDVDTFWTSVERELEEEVGLTSHFSYNVAGLLNDDSNQVGKVHLGVVVRVRLLPQAELCFKDTSLSQGDFESIETLKKNVENFESWSSILIKNLL